MPAFVWKGKTRAGKTVTGERVADTMDAAMALLRREQILVSSVKAKGKEIALPKLGGGVPAKNLAVFTRQFSVMIDAGLPLVQCLEILGSQQENKNFAKILQQTRMDVEGGASLADAMRKHPKAFDDLFTNMIAAGEAGGILDTILKRLATYIEKAVKLQGPGQGRHDLPDRRHRHRRHRRRRHPVEGHPDLRRRCSPASAPSCRCRPASSSRCRNWFVRLLPFLVVVGVAGDVRSSGATTRPTAAAASSTGWC